MKAKKIRNVISTVTLIVGFLLALAALAPKLFGYTAMSVSTGSMEPTIPKGSLILVKPVNLENVKEGDVLTFEKDDKTARFTHRVVGVQAETGLIFTRGDANNVDDPAPTSIKNCVGRVEKSLPLLGYLSAAINSTYGIIVILLLYILWLAFEIEALKSRKNAKNSEVEKND